MLQGPPFRMMQDPFRGHPIRQAPNMKGDPSLRRALNRGAPTLGDQEESRMRAARGLVVRRWLTTNFFTLSQTVNVQGTTERMWDTDTSQKLLSISHILNLYANQYYSIFRPLRSMARCDRRGGLVRRPGCLLGLAHNSMCREDLVS